jgi:hypothetical protein
MMRPIAQSLDCVRREWGTGGKQKCLKQKPALVQYSILVCISCGEMLKTTQMVDTAL